MLNTTTSSARDRVRRALRRLDIGPVAIRGGTPVPRGDRSATPIPAGRDDAGQMSGRDYVEACEAWAAPTRRRTS